MGKLEKNLILIIVFTCFALSPLVLTVYSQSATGARGKTRMVYIDLNKVAEYHPSWKQASDNVILGREMLKPVNISCPPNPAAFISKCNLPDLSSTSNSSLNAIEEADNRELTAFEASELAVAESWVQSHINDIYQSCDAESIGDRQKCVSDLSKRLRFISEKYAAKALPLQLKISVLDNNTKLIENSAGPMVIARPDLPEKIADLKKQLAEVYAERDREWTAALDAAKKAEDSIRLISSAKAQKQIDNLWSMAMSQVSQKLQDRKSALSKKNCIPISQGQYSPSACWDNDDITRRCPEAVLHRARVNRESKKLLNTNSLLQAAAKRDAKAFIEAWARSRGEKPVFDPTLRKKCSDLTEEYAREFSRRLSGTG